MIMIKKLEKIRSEKGFTLAELLVVILIIAILATLAIVFFTGQEETAGDNVAAANLRSAYSAAQTYYVDEGGTYNSASDVANAIEANTNLSADVLTQVTPAQTDNGPPAVALGANVVGVSLAGSDLTLVYDGFRSLNGDTPVANN